MADTVTTVLGGGAPVEPNQVAIRSARSTREPQQYNDPHQKDSARADFDPSDVSAKLEELNKRLETAEKRLRDKDSYISRLEEDARAWRQLAETQISKPSVEEPEETNPFEDPTVQEHLRSLAESDPAKFAQVITEYAASLKEDTVKRDIEQLRNELRSYNATQQQIQLFKQELAEAAQISSEAEQIVLEAVESDFKSGALVEHLRQNPTLVTVPGGVSGLVARLALTTKPESQPTSNRNIMSSRPKGQTQVLAPETPSADEEIDMYKKLILNAKDRGKLPFQN